ncbi:MAG: hypothetical protein Fur0043_17980 [Anaerolineales bacterium]
MSRTENGMKTSFYPAYPVKQSDASDNEKTISDATGLSRNCLPLQRKISRLRESAHFFA